MEKTFREKIILYYRKLIKEHRRLRVPAFVVLSFALGLHDVVRRIAGGWKKYAFTSFLLLLFLVGSSFTYPVFGGEVFNPSVADRPEVGPAEATVEPAADQAIDREEIKLLEDEDVLNGHEDAELAEVDDLDKYSLDEILEGNQFIETERVETPGRAVNINFQADDWRLILINKQHPIPDDYAVNLGTIKGSMQCDERIINDLLSMLQGAKEDGVALVICSPFRDLSRQEMLFERKINAYMRNGLSYLEAYRLSSQTVTVPGASEHQLGLAIDITSDDYNLLDAGFADTAAGRWLNEHCYEYGFILRYPEGKEYITSIEFEPWHFRYVGKEAAAIITEQGLTLEEFADKYL